MAIPIEALSTLWYRALASEIGISITTNERKLMVKYLYATREELGDPNLMDLTIQQPGKSDEVWICHKAVEIPEE